MTNQSIYITGITWTGKACLIKVEVVDETDTAFDLGKERRVLIGEMLDASLRRDRQIDKSEYSWYRDGYVALDNLYEKAFEHRSECDKKCHDAFTQEQMLSGVKLEEPEKRDND